MSKVEAVIASGFDTPGLSLDQDPVWLQLPDAKKEIGLRRLKVMLDHDSQQGRTKAEAQAAADQIGVKLRSFYALLKLWREAKRSPLVLVPFGVEAEPRRSRLHEDVAAQLRELAAARIAECPSAAAGELIAEIKRDLEGVVPLPSDVTIRSYLDRAREEHRPSPGSISAASFGFSNQDQSNGLGDVLIIDHITPADILIRSPAGALPPTITLAFDEFTGAPLGEAAYLGVPTGDAVLQALESAKLRLAREAPGCDLSRSTVVFASTFDREWRGLGEELNAQNFSSCERAEARLRSGHVARQLIGSSLDKVALQYRLPVRATAEDQIDRERKTLLSLSQASFIVSKAVDTLFLRRITSEDRDRVMPSRRKEEASTARIEMHGLSSFIAAFDDCGLNNTEMQRAQDEFLRLRRQQSGKKPIAENGSSSNGRSSSIFRHQLERLANQIAGRSALAVSVHPPAEGQPTWILALTVDDPVLATPIWIELAREAIALADLEATLLRIDVKVQSGND